MLYPMLSGMMRVRTLPLAWQGCSVVRVDMGYGGGGVVGGEGGW